MKTLASKGKDKNKDKANLLRLRSGGFRARYGHLIPRIIESLPKRSLRELQAIWLKLVPHLAGRNEHETSPLALQLRDAILNEWATRSKAAFRDPESFVWPTTEIGGRGDGHVDAHGWQPLGMIGFLGYHVGTTHGLTDGNRRAILDAAFSAVLPPLNGPTYMRDWGEPASSNRLRKLAESLAAFTRNAKRRRFQPMEAAIADWEHDLRYLKIAYYDGRFGFGWPALAYA